MTLRRAISAVTTCAFVFTCSIQTLSAADSHTVTSAQLHQAVVAAHARVAAARKAMDDLLARQDVQTRMERVGLVPAKVRAQVAMLGDAEIMRLHAQVMNGSLQTARAGQSAADDVTTIILVVLICAALAGVLLYYAAFVNSNSYY